MKTKPAKINHRDIRPHLTLSVNLLIIVLACCFVIVGNLMAAELVLTGSQQDGYTNDHQYNVTDPVLLCGQQRFVAVMEFPLPSNIKVGIARLYLHVLKVKKPGRVALYHLVSFNNGYAETQDFYATAQKLGEAQVEHSGEISFDVTKAVKKDAQGPGGFTSYRLEGRGAELVLSAYESGKDQARIKIE